MINLLLFILTGIALSAGSLQIGAVWSKWFGLRESNAPAILQWGLGVVSLTFLLTFLGCIGLYKPWAMWVILAIWLLFAAIHFMQKERWLSFIRLGFKIDADSLLLVSILLILAACFGTVMTPETRHDPYDYHLSIPNTYLAHGKIIEMPWHVFTYMPKNGEILYGFALGLGNDSLAKLIHFLFGCGCLLVLGTFLKRVAGSAIACLAVFFAVSLPLYGFIATAAYIDLIRSFWELLALFVLYLLWDEENTAQQKILICLSVLFAGMAVGTKYTAWLIFLGPYLTLLLLTIFYRRKAVSFPVLFTSAILLILPVGFWLTLNACWTGNPMYPFFPALFGIHTPSAMDAYEFIRGHAPDKEQIFSLKIFGYFFERFFNLLLEGNVQVLLGFIALALFPFIKKDSKTAQFPMTVYRGLLLFILLSYLCFFLGSNNKDGRFCFSTLLLLSIPLALAFSILQKYTSEMKSWHSKLATGIILLLLANALWYRYITLDTMKESFWPRITESQRSAYLQQRFPSYPFMNWCNHNLPKDAYVLGLGYPLQRKCIYGTKHGYIPFLEKIPTTISPQDLYLKIRQAGITHLIKPFPKTQYTIPWEILEPTYLQPVYQYQSVTIYKIIPPGNG